MNSTLLRVLAALLAVGAVVTAWMGYRLSTKPAPPPQIQVAPPSYSQVVAAKALPAGHLILAEDVRLASSPQRDPNGYESVRDVVGKLTVDPVDEGTSLLSSHFLKLGMVAQSLKPGERAVAVKVNEVIGVGGFINPGDHVDVLLYLRADRETGNVSSSQVVLRNVRVLAYGDNAAETQESSSAALPTLSQGSGKQQDKPSGADKDAKQIDTKKSKASKSAILAVPEPDVSKLMLADSSGQLRLALRGAEPAPLSAEADVSQFMKLKDIASGDGKKPVQAVSGVKRPAAKPGQATTARRAKETGATTVIVHRGDKVEVVKVAD